MRKLILIAHTSLDGFVAWKNVLLDGFEASEENLDFVCRLTSDADTALLCRISYQLLESFWPTAAQRHNATEAETKYSCWYNTASKIILSRTMPGKRLKNTTVIKDDLFTEIVKAKNGSGKNILIFGSLSVFQYLFQFDLIDGLWIFINPVIFGQGIPLFRGRVNAAKLRLLSTKQFANGEIAVNYAVERNRSV